ncbi:DNA_helicase [Hexamita inflata]|uniref:Putative n=1 Tax=Hexamita inflata TaxID=28002 RepID=A0AA86TWF9_9EUKA|nr:DNA helicase [Hexamita inflata]
MSSEPACAICGFACRQFLAQCKDCNKWFCNQKLGDETKSHAYQHLVDEKHVSFSYPYNTVGNQDPSCCVCGQNNAMRMAFLQENDEIVFVCHRECIQSNELDSWTSMVIPTKFISNKQFSVQLIPVPTTEIVKLQQETDQLKPKEGQDAQAFEIMKNQSDLKVENAAMVLIQQESAADKLKQIEASGKFLPKFPSRFDKKVKDIVCNNGEPLILRHFQKEYSEGLIQWDQVHNIVSSTDAAIQRNIDKVLNYQVNYSQMFKQALELDLQHTLLTAQQKAKEFQPSLIYVRQKPRTGAFEFVITGWNRYETINGQIIKMGDSLLVELTDVNGVITQFNTMIADNNEYLVLKCHSPLPEDKLVKFKDFANIEIGGLKFSDVVQESALGNTKIFNGHDVWRLQDNIRFIVQKSEQSKVVERQIVAVEAIQNNLKETKLYQILLGMNNATIDEEIKKHSKQILPQTNIDEIMANLTSHVQLHMGFAPNEAQDQAIRKVLTNCISMIQGCPGGGKTLIASCIIQGLLQLHKSKKPAKVLCCTGSNIAADNIAVFCKKLNLNAMRVYAKSLEDESLNYKKLDEISQISLNKIIEQNIDNKVYVSMKMITEEQNQALKVYQLSEELFNDWQEQQTEKYDPKSYMQNVEKYELNKVDVIICTAATSGDSRLRRLVFDAVVLDESSQSIEPDQMIAIQHTTKHVIIIGDHNQLGPTVSFKGLQSCGFSKSLYSRLLQLGVGQQQLNIQYRMHSGLLEFANSEFYKGVIRPGVVDSTRMLKQRIVLPNGISKLIKTNFPSIFIETKGREERIESTKSYTNQQEVDMISQLIRNLLMEYQVTAKDIGVITPYSAQQTLLLKEISKISQDIEINSVDGFQGREKEIIIFSAVRSNTDGNIGFLKDKRRLNVSMTRARKLFIMIANATTLESDETWANMINYYKQKGVIFQGKTIQDLKQIKAEKEKGKE